MTRALILTAALTVSAACTPAQLATWGALLDLPADPHDPAHLAADAWCLHGTALVDLVGWEAARQALDRATRRIGGGA